MTRENIFQWAQYVATSLVLGWLLVLVARLLHAPYGLYKSLITENQSLKTQLAGYSELPSLRVVFNQADPRYSREHKTQPIWAEYNIGVQNTSLTKTIKSVVITASGSPLLKKIRELQRMNYGEVLWSGSIDPQHIEMIHIIGFDPQAFDGSAIGNPCNFWIIARGEDAAETIMEFEWRPHEWPILRPANPPTAKSGTRSLQGTEPKTQQ